MNRVCQHRNGSDDGGAVTAELAIGLLGLTIILACLLSVIRVGVVRLQVQDAASAGARAAARGEAVGVVQTTVATLAGPATTQLGTDGAFTTVTVRRELGLALPGTPNLTLTASASALTEQIP